VVIGCCVNVCVLVSIGWIPLMLPFGLVEIGTKTLDFPSLYHTVRLTGREITKNLLIGKI
jgi:C-8 sterol isomerase